MKPACLFESIIVSVCTRVENLWAVRAGAFLIHHAQNAVGVRLPLRQIYINAMPLFHALPPDHHIFSELTHVELIGPPSEGIDVICSTITRLPRLTHLAFNDEEFIPMCPHFLENCALLSVLVSLDGKPLPASAFDQYEGVLAQDPRFVVMFPENWAADWWQGVYAGRDY
ncbi:hypothetical protein DFH07DRAFT_177403 [Mycena maculata]|uniref:Uncharacterized protein n=1 Tax=Mycena maculata TaxID=230809 RepID=A0AAD7HWF2_9AGAR|nr:hypothetical protein DFH07DRAFT_177403 [Mycena maculata]